MTSIQVTDVVVGAGSGMGAACAQELAQSERLILADRNADAVEALAAEIGAEARIVDLLDTSSFDALVDSVDRVGSLIITAGVSGGAPGEIALAINLIGVVRLLEALDGAVGEGTGIVLFASMTELMPPDQAVVDVLDDPLHPDFLDRLRAAGADPSDPAQGYMLSKVGIIRYMKTHAFHLWQRGARIVTISPGLIDTPMLAQTSHLPVVQDMKNAIVGRFGTPAEVAQVASFLSSTRASYVTGINVAVDGGYVNAIQESAEAKAAFAASMTASSSQIDSLDSPETSR